MIVTEPFNTYRLRKNFWSPSDYKNADSPAEVKFNRELQTKKSTPDLEFGRFFHTYILEPDKLSDEIIKVDISMFPHRTENDDGTIRLRTKANQVKLKELRDQANVQGKTLVMPQHTEMAERMKQALHIAIPQLTSLIDPDEGKIESSFYGIAKFDKKGYFDGFRDTDSFFPYCEENELPVKTRPDYIRNDARYGADLKTCSCCKPHVFAADCVNYGYDAQAAFIMDFCGFMLNQTVADFYFIVVEKKTKKDELINAVCYMTPENMMLNGREIYQIRLEQIYKSIKSGNWQGMEIHSGCEYDGMVSPVTIPYPFWAIKDKRFW